MKTMDQVLSYMQLVLGLVGEFGVVSGATGIAGKLLAIAQAAVAAHEGITGQPLDMARLHQITPVE